MKQPLLPFSRDDLFGYCDICENEVISPRFRYADESIEGVAVATTLDNDVVLIDVESLAEVTLKGWSNGTSSFSYGLLAVQDKSDKDSPVGFVDRAGNFVISPRYYIARNFDHLGATVQLERGGVQHRINRHGEVIGSKFLQIGWFHPQGRLTGARVQWDYPGEVVINEQAEQITDELYNLVWKENEGLIPVVFDQSTVGWLNADGVELRRLAGDGIGHHFQGGLVPLKERDGKWGFIDLEENWVIDPEFDVVDFVAPTRLILGHYRNNNPDDSPNVYLADLAGNRIGEASGSIILPFDKDGIACIWRPNDASEYGLDHRN